MKWVSFSPNKGNKNSKMTIYGIRNLAKADWSILQVIFFRNRFFIYLELCFQTSKIQFASNRKYGRVIRNSRLSVYKLFHYD
jgi:hypothetical protein